jgi:hypothetical protein
MHSLGVKTTGNMGRYIKVTIEGFGRPRFTAKNTQSTTTPPQQANTTVHTSL